MLRNDRHGWGADTGVRSVARRLSAQCGTNAVHLRASKASVTQRGVGGFLPVHFRATMRSTEHFFSWCRLGGMNQERRFPADS
jgi:hypothetical protein